MPETEAGDGLRGVVDQLAGMGQERERVTIGAVQDAMGARGFGPFLLVPALLEISPIGGIPGLPTALAAIIILMAAQMALGRDGIWLPGFIRHRGVSGGRLRKAMDYVRPLARWTDWLVRPRLEWALRRPWINLAALLCILLALSVPPLELVPFASTAPFGTIGLLGLAILGRDGLLMLLGAALSLGSFVVLYLGLR